MKLVVAGTSRTNSVKRFSRGSKEEGKRKEGFWEDAGKVRKGRLKEAGTNQQTKRKMAANCCGKEKGSKQAIQKCVKY